MLLRDDWEADSREYPAISRTLAHLNKIKYIHTH